MTAEQIKTEFAKLSEMLSAWQEGEEIAAIERDLALDKLKTIYDALRFKSKLEISAKETITPVIPAISTPEVEKDQTCAQDEEDAEENEVEVEFLFAEDDDEGEELEQSEPIEELYTENIEEKGQSESEVVASITEESAPANNLYESKIATEPAPAVTTHEPVHVHVHVHAPATVTTPSAEPVATPEPTITPIETNHAQESKQTPKETTEPKKAASPLLFGPEEVVRKPRSKHQRMMSIYSDRPSTSDEKAVDISKIFDIDSDSDNTKSEDLKVAEQPKKIEEQKVVILAETIAPATPTLAETIIAPTPLAEEITLGKINSLTDVIGINDKFLMIRDLFDGDSDAYAEAIATLDEFDSFDDCMIHIVENYAWNPDSEGAKFIMQLLERKLS